MKRRLGSAPFDATPLDMTVTAVVLLATIFAIAATL